MLRRELGGKEKNKLSIFPLRFQHLQPTNLFFQSESRDNLHQKHIHIYRGQMNRVIRGQMDVGKGFKRRVFQQI